MGTTSRLLLSCGVCMVIFVHFIGYHHVTAEFKDDSDLVFDSIEQTNENHHRIARDRYSIINSSPSVEEQDHHWFSGAVNRIKRSIGSLFSSSDHKNKPRSKKSPQGSDVYGQQEAQEEYDDVDENNIDPDFEAHGFNNNHSSSSSFINEFDDNDDEDDFDNSGDGSGSIETSTSHIIPSFETTHPVYFRIVLTIVEPFREEYKDRNNNIFRALSDSLVIALSEILKDLPGTREITVVRIKRHMKDSFKIQAVIDISSTGFSDGSRIKRSLIDHIQTNRKIGDHEATPEDFQFEQFDGLPSGSCVVNELPCLDGQCVDRSARCNGFNDCADGSDEKNCPNTIIPTDNDDVTRSFGGVSNDSFNIFGEDEGSGAGEGQSKCRGDDVVRCPDGSRSICDIHKCDGTKDCDDGWDELNCPSNDCATNEFVCDISRCFPMNKRCDGVADCDDETDEHHCPPKTCTGFLCDGSRCLSDDKRCNNQRDCNDNTDEAGCPPSSGGQSCRPGQFSCGPPNYNCIPDYQKCDNRADCASGIDERNCAPQGSPGCTEKEFTCGNGHCIPMSDKCDRKYDCEDQSDERNCSCKVDDFHCANGFCIPKSQRCDGIHNCQDGSDEKECSPRGACAHHQWQCADGKCIDRMHLCNFQIDCPDKSDELNCTRCRHDQFRCNDGSCLNIAKRCDGVGDCTHSEDEELCATCTSNQFKCRTNECVDVRRRCDGTRDCQDGSDEYDCQLNGKRTLTCTSNTWKCHDNFRCIEQGSVCDGKIDCQDKSDEKYCKLAAYTAPTEISPQEGNTCKDGEFQCAAGFCIMDYKRCNNIKDCPSGNDEENCPTTTTPSPYDPNRVECGVDEVRCEDGSCGKKCDGIFNCPDGQDELDCKLCSPYQFKCTNGDCIDDNLRCNGHPECTDNSDEESCGCRPTEFDCGNGTCISNTFVCDDFKDCLNGEDELNCSSLECRSDEIECNPERRCLPENLRCDGRNDCSDGSDEFDCVDKSPRQCAQDEFRCDDNACIPQYLVCNGAPECPDRSDEAASRCRDCNETEWFQCSDGSCIEIALRCDNFYDCRDFSDEQNCFECKSNEFQCLNRQCIYYNLHCNGRNDCSDNSDEDGCRITPTYPPVTDAPPTPARPISCPSGTLPCASGQQCISQSSFCNGKADCYDLSDERNCDGGQEGLDLRTYPPFQDILENRQVVIVCRDEGPRRARVRWTRPNGEPLPPGSQDIKGRLEMPDIKVQHSGAYICEAVGYPPNTPGAQVSAQLRVDPLPVRPTRPPTACGLDESTCSNGECIPKSLVCNGRYDCTDGSDENRCNLNGCEPNEFSCANKKCILKTWRCDSEDDCGDGSDESNCATNPPGSLCQYHQFACHSNNQCIPKSYHCDVERDCVDGSDELGCSKPYVSIPPPPMVNLVVGQIFSITCTAVGVPTPEVVWRRNWGHIPSKCRTTSENGFGTLTCDDIQIEDQGAYSCEVINIKGQIFAVPDAILTVTGPNATICPPGYFNEAARTQSECIKCFCFGQSTQCTSADLFVYQFEAPFDQYTLKVVGVKTGGRTIEIIREEPIMKDGGITVGVIGRNGMHSEGVMEMNQPDVSPYFSLPESYHGNQLKSYGGSLRYEVKFSDRRGPPVDSPDIIITGNNYTLIHKSRTDILPDRLNTLSARLFEGEWEHPNYTPATREEIMMTLANVDSILLKLVYQHGAEFDTVISNIELDSAGTYNKGGEAATYVEECICPIGYTGNSCETCSDGYQRHKSGGAWLGKCQEIEAVDCPPGSYRDPTRGGSCEICPCPLTNPGNQFGRTCSWQNGDVICDCPVGFVGRRCEQCAPGYVGNPNTPGDSCVPYTPQPRPSTCNENGALDRYGERCQCKQNVEGPDCGQCKNNTFHLSSKNQFGCISCFCMAVTSKCTSSNLYRDTISTAFTSSRNSLTIVDTENREQPIVTGIRLDTSSREISYSDFSGPNVYYWSLPSRYLGNKISSYGGYLRYTLKYEPLPGGQSSRNSAADVELVSKNEVTFLYYAREQPQHTGAPHTFEVPLLEQYWQRSDGNQADREMFIVALADLSSIYIKATYTTNTRQASLISVSLDVGEERNTGNLERALEVEQCQCPPGYNGLSCEDCDVGYTRGDVGIYLSLCVECNCNRHSNECHPETGECYNCRDYTTGRNCDQCLPGYEGNPAVEGCRRSGQNQPDYRCNCDTRGSISNECYNGACRCKANVEGNNCDRCRVGSFGLNASISDGCQTCYCSGVSTECSESNLNILQIPVTIIEENHGFVLTDRNRYNTIRDGFTLKISTNEIGYNLRPGDQEQLYWSLPTQLTGNKIRSYGGRLEFTQTFVTRGGNPQLTPDQHVVIIGRSGVTIFWVNPARLMEGRPNKISVLISTRENWQRLDQSGTYPATREDILKTLTDIEAILIRAQPFTDTETTFISDISLDTAVDQETGQPRAVDVEICRCPPGYKDTSCETCTFGYYRDVYDTRAGPFGSCAKCSCNGQSCHVGPDQRVECDCSTGYSGRYCENTEIFVELSPLNFSQMIVGLEMNIECKYKSVGRYNIDVEILSEAYKKFAIQGESHTTQDGATRSIILTMGCLPVIVKCTIKDQRNNQVIVSKESHIYPVFPLPGLIPTPDGQYTPAPPTIEIVITSKKLEIKEVGSSVSFSCTARSLKTNRPPRIEWRKDGGELSRDAIDDGRGLLVITNLKISDTGRYICQATDEFSVNYEYVTLEVGSNRPSRPEVTVNHPLVDVQESRPIEFVCVVKGNPLPDVRVIRLDGQPLNPRHQFSNGVFRIEQSLKSDAGYYQCIGQNEAGTEQANIQVYVREQTGQFIRVTITPEQYEGRTRESFQLRCVSDNRPGIDIRWSKQNGILPYSSTESYGTLTVNDARLEDAGVYICTVYSNDGTRGSSKASVSILDSTQVIYPGATVRPERILISQGSSAELYCEATGAPPPSVKWSKLSSDLSRNVEQIGSTLFFRNVDVSDRGIYVCVVTNVHGISQASATVEVNRLESPMVSIYPQAEQTVVSGNSASFYCQIGRGIPTPRLKWTRPGGRPLGGNIEELSGGTLRFHQVSIDQEGEYVCTAENEAGSTTATARIFVNTEPEVWTIPRDDLVSTTVGQSVRLECHSSGKPAPTVSWQHEDGRQINLQDSQTDFRTRDAAVIEINRVSQQDEGIYTCRAQNSVGVRQKIVRLVVNTLPNRGDITGSRPRPGEDATGNQNPNYRDNEPPRFRPEYDELFSAPVGTRAEIRCNINNIRDERLTVNWVRSDNTSLPPSAYVSGGTLYIDNVEPAAAGLYKCLGLERGQVIFSLVARLDVISQEDMMQKIVTGKHTAPPRITLTPQRQVVHPGDNAYIQCTATGEQPIDIFWSPMNRDLPQSVTTQGGTIVFRNIKLEDAGRYRCTARNNAGEADAVADVIVEENVHSPRVTAENRDQTAPLGSSVTLRCKVQDNSRSNIRWFREHYPLPPNSRVDQELLHLYDVQEVDAGKYFCEISTDKGQTSSDYIDLHVSKRAWYCPMNKWHCDNIRCIFTDQRCNGVDDCGDNSDEMDCNSNRTIRSQQGVPVASVPPPTIYISPPEQTRRSGEFLDLHCQTNEPGVILTWTKLNGWLSDNVRREASTLRFDQLRAENSGTYRCETSGQEGAHNFKDYNLVVVDENDVKDEAPIETKTEPLGSSVLMECKTDLEGPVRYAWKKQDSNLPQYIDITSRTLELQDVGSESAGTYICIASNENKQIELPTILIVTGIVPYFAQARVSYIALQTLPDPYVQFSLEISFKPENSDGLILYNGNSNNKYNGDFISLVLKNGVPEFRFNLGHSVTLVSADAPVSPGNWHTVKIIRNKKKATMYVDGNGPFIGNADGKYIGLDLSEPLYLGGVPSFDQISPLAGSTDRFVGCISRLKIGHEFHDIIREAQVKEGITTCETCTEKKCENRGVCQEALSVEGFTCICPSGFSGPTCNKLKGEACSPYACGTGRCVDNDHSFECMCPMGRSGRRCENEITINEPGFQNNAYVAYPTLKPLRRLKASLRLKPSDFSDGLIFYSAETEEGHGDFASLAIKNHRLEFRFGVGNTTTVVRSNQELVPNEWVAITASRNLNEGRLIVDGVPVIGRSQGNHKALNLLTRLYVGGVDQEKIKINQGVGVTAGFNGCISEINIAGLDIDLISSAEDSANVNDCTAVSNNGNNDEDENNILDPKSSEVPPYKPSQTGCSSNPCQNNGQCYPLSPVVYKCSCTDGFSGNDCEIPPNPNSNLCDDRRPCQNGGFCNGNSTSYKCSCPLGFAGVDCQHRADLRNDAHFDGDSYLEFRKSYLDLSSDNEDEIIALELSTNSSNGLIFWYGQRASDDGEGRDYVSLGLVNGFLEYSFDLGSGPAIIQNSKVTVNDGYRHSVILKRHGREGSIEIDNSYTESGESGGITNTLNCSGNIYLGGTPNIPLMTGNKFVHGFEGCIHQFELQNSKTLELGSHALSGRNVKPCSRSEGGWGNINETPPSN